MDIDSASQCIGHDIYDRDLHIYIYKDQIQSILDAKICKLFSLILIPN